VRQQEEEELAEGIRRSLTPQHSPTNSNLPSALSFGRPPVAPSNITAVSTTTATATANAAAADDAMPGYHAHMVQKYTSQGEGPGPGDGEYNRARTPPPLSPTALAKSPSRSHIHIDDEIEDELAPFEAYSFTRGVSGGGSDGNGGGGGGAAGGSSLFSWRVVLERDPRRLESWGMSLSDALSTGK
jgi:hypothetical protein